MSPILMTPWAEAAPEVKRATQNAMAADRASMANTYVDLVCRARTVRSVRREDLMRPLRRSLLQRVIVRLRSSAPPCAACGRFAASIASRIGREERGSFSLRWIASRITLSSLKAIRNCSIIACVVASSVGKFFTNTQWSMQLSSSTGVMKWQANGSGCSRRARPRARRSRSARCRSRSPPMLGAV